jgi:hypothetical protein
LSVARVFGPAAGGPQWKSITHLYLSSTFRWLRAHAQVGSPVSRRLGHLDVSHQRVEHQLKQVLLAGQVPVQRHSTCPQHLSDLPHADRFGAFTVRDRDRDVDYLFATQP